MTYACRICGNSDNNIVHIAKEMMFGTRELSSYVECSRCGCLQSINIKGNAKYYNNCYYSFADDPEQNRSGPVKELLKSLRNRYAVTGRGVLGRFLYAKYPNKRLQLLSRIPLTEDLHVLDVGCGSGILLYNLHHSGFRNLLGIDP